MKKNIASSYFQWIAFNIIPVFFLLAFIGLVIQISYLDGLRGVALSIEFKDSSVYASDYSNKKYETIKIGTSKKAVIDILGPPLRIDTWKDIERLHYSASTTGSHYRVRQVCLAEGIVVEKVHYYYVD